MNRGSRHWNIFLDDQDRVLFLRLLANMSDRFGVKIISYCLMGNHFHVLLQCTESNLSSAMHWLACRYAKLFNGRHGFDGSLCRSRFTSVEVTDDNQLLTAVRYIHRNPLELNPNYDLASYEWSSHSAYLGWAPVPDWLSVETVLGQFGQNPPSFQDFVETSLPSDKVPTTNRSIEQARHGEGRSHSVSTVTPADVQRAVAQSAGIDVRLVQQPRKPSDKQARLAALLLCVDEVLLAPISLTDTFDFSTPGALRTALSRARQRAQTDTALANLVADAKQLLDM